MPLRAEGKQRFISEIRKQIETRELQPGERIASTRAIAEMYRISLQTAHKALGELVETGWLESRARSGTYVSDRERVPSNTNVGIVLQATRHIWEGVATDFMQGLQNIHIMPTIVDTTGFDEKQLSGHFAFQEMLKRKPEVIVFQESRVWDVFTRPPKGVRLIRMGANDPLTDPFVGDSVVPHFYQGGYLAARHLVKRGCRKIACYMVRSHAPRRLGAVAGSQRHFYEGFLRALEEEGLRDDSELILCPTLGKGENKIRQNFKANKKIDGVVCVADYRAVELIKVLREMGIRVPEDIGVVSAYNTPYAESHELTSVDYHFDHIVREITRLIKRHIREKGDYDKQNYIMIQPELVKRNSVL